MLRDSCLGCQYRDLRTKFRGGWIEHSTLVRQRGGTTAEKPGDPIHVVHPGSYRRWVPVTLYACVRERETQCSFVNGKNGHEGAGVAREFVTTRWSLILSAANLGSEEQKTRDALAELCRVYWRPIFLFVRARGYSIEDAQDLTQDLFL